MKFTDILQELNIEYKTEGHHHCRPGWINLDCPFCGKDSHKWHLGYSIESNFFHCWRCGFHSIIETLMEITGYSATKCKKILKDVEYTEVKREKPKGKLILPKGIGKLQKPHRRYLRSRRFNWKKIQNLWQISGIGIASKLPWRIFIPILHHGKMVSWTTRSISNSNMVTRYISASLKEESIPHKSLLYGEDYAQKTIVITEGPFDVWKIGPGAVATLGIGYSLEQLLRMTKYPKRMVCFDHERIAQERAKRLCNELSVFPGKTFNIQLDAKDAASATNREIERIRKEIL